MFAKNFKMPWSILYISFLSPNILIIIKYAEKNFIRIENISFISMQYVKKERFPMDILIKVWVDEVPKKRQNLPVQSSYIWHPWYQFETVWGSNGCSHDSYFQNSIYLILHASTYQAPKIHPRGTRKNNSSRYPIPNLSSITPRHHKYSRINTNKTVRLWYRNIKVHSISPRYRERSTCRLTTQQKNHWWGKAVCREKTPPKENRRS